MPSPMRWRGVDVCSCTPPIVTAMERELGRPVTITQGGYNKGGVAASAGTHDLGGALDLTTNGNNADDLNMISVGRTVGFSCWIRQPDEGPWAQHWHGVINGCPHRAPLAVQQEASLRNGRNGLKNQALDPHRSLGIPVRTYAEYLEDEMPLTDADIQKIANAVWAKKFNVTNYDAPLAAGSIIGLTLRNVNRTREGIGTVNENLWKAVVPRLDSISSKLDKVIAGAGGVVTAAPTLDQIKVAVVDEFHRRLGTR